MSLCLTDSTLQSGDRKAFPFPKKPQGWKEQILDKWQAVTALKGCHVSNMMAAHMQGDPGEVRIINTVILDKIHPT